MIFDATAARRMEAPPFDVAAMLGEELGNRKGWKDVLREADELVEELDKVLVRMSCNRWSETQKYREDARRERIGRC